jgi:hypothetical protein
LLFANIVVVDMHIIVWVTLAWVTIWMMKKKLLKKVAWWQMTQRDLSVTHSSKISSARKLRIEIFPENYTWAFFLLKEIIWENSLCKWHSGMTHFYALIGLTLEVISRDSCVHQIYMLPLTWYWALLWVSHWCIHTF